MADTSILTLIERVGSTFNHAISIKAYPRQGSAIDDLIPRLTGYSVQGDTRVREGVQ